MQNKINNNPKSKFQTLNSTSKFQNPNSKFHSGITLIALVVTVVLLMILAGVTISATLGDNGLWKNVTNNAANQEKQLIKTQIEIIATNWVTQKTLNDAVTEDDLKQEYVNEKIVASKDKVEGGNGDFQITTIKGYVYHLVIDIQGNVNVEYIGNEGAVSSKIGYLAVTETSSNSITVEVKLKNPSETYQFTYSYKKQEDETYTTIEPSSTSNTYTFTGLKSYQVYDLKVIVVSGEESTELKTSAITTNVKSGAVKQAEGSPIWNSSTRTAIVKLEATIEMPEGSKIQYKVNGEEPWKDYTDQINGLNHGDSISARIYSEVDGVLGEGNILVEDSIEPKPATIVLSNEETTPNTAITATVTHTDDETGINISDCKWVYTTKEEAIGTQDANLGEYTGSFSSNGQKLTLTAEAEGTYYLHVLSVDIAGNRTETISSGVVVEASKLPTVHPIEGGTANANATVTTRFGKIDIIWLDGTTNEPSSLQTPNSPASYLNGMTPVKWTGTTEGTTTVSDKEWYSYEPATGTADSKTSHWANAKTTGTTASYFVWIPRYAYRITYYDKNPNTDSTAAVTGYYDGFGMWNIDGQLKYELESGVETVNYGDYSYIVHPAFTTNLDMGGWSTNLPGFWFAKFEMSRSSSSTLASAPGVASYRSATIGTFYTTARSATYGMTGTGVKQDTDGKTSFMNSHMAKNSEWGAVAYLTHSKYGRNGYEVTMNLSGYDCLAGGGTGTAYMTANKDQSTTGNSYGVYDMSAGSYEYTASFDRKSTSLSNGSIFASNGKASTKYATAYENGTATNYSATMVYDVSKTGDGIKEVFANLTGNPFLSWFNDACYFANGTNPFFTYSGCAAGNSSDTLPGIFYSSPNNGSGSRVISFRAVLCP